MLTSAINSFAKINIGLRILKKRDDGYHDLETIFYPIKLHDELTIEIQRSKTDRNSVILRSNKSFIPLTRENLCFKAVEHFFTVFKIKECFKISITLNKNIPVGGGLGGGSSNAATALKFLIKYFNINIEQNKDKIIKLALSLGSDVPFFLALKPCYAYGRGERMVMLKIFKVDYDILIVNPNLHVSTKWAFEKLNFRSNYSTDPLLNEVKIFDASKKNIFVNDFENVVFKKFIELKKIKEEMYEMGAVYSSLSGTGATMFAFFGRNKKGTLNKCREYYNAKNYFTFISD